MHILIAMALTETLYLVAYGEWMTIAAFVIATIVYLMARETHGSMVLKAKEEGALPLSESVIEAVALFVTLASMMYIAALFITVMFIITMESQKEPLWWTFKAMDSVQNMLF